MHILLGLVCFETGSYIAQTGSELAIIVEAGFELLILLPLPSKCYYDRHELLIPGVNEYLNCVCMCVRMCLCACVCVHVCRAGK